MEIKKIYESGKNKSMGKVVFYFLLRIGNCGWLCGFMSGDFKRCFCYKWEDIFAVFSDYFAEDT